MPFWAMSAEVTVLLKGAQIGWDSWQPVYNPATRQAPCTPLLLRDERMTMHQGVRAAHCLSRRWQPTRQQHVLSFSHVLACMRRRYEQQLRTSWRRVELRQMWQRKYSASDEGMQVGGNFPLTAGTSKQALPLCLVMHLGPQRLVVKGTCERTSARLFSTMYAQPAVESTSLQLAKMVCCTGVCKLQVPAGGHAATAAGSRH